MSLTEKHNLSVLNLFPTCISLNELSISPVLGLKEFHEECLAIHNEYRLRHGAAPLHWSAELAWEAQQWAENLARSGELRHNDDDTVGENLAGMMGGELTGREATDMWYDEIEDYNFDNPGYSEDTSNFSQVSCTFFVLIKYGIPILILCRVTVQENKRMKSSVRHKTH